MSLLLDRRGLLRLGGAGVALTAFPRVAFADDFASPPTIVPIRISQELITHITVCLRPFRRAGPRIEAEKLGSKTIVHNYGHGGSGWSLSWGSAEEALALLRQIGERSIAVVGAGAIGLTSAIAAQRAGMKVTIYAKERFPDVRSARATGMWSPDSRIAMQTDIDAAFEDRWERMARTSFAQFSNRIGKGDEVELTDRYYLYNPEPEESVAPSIPAPAAEAEPKDHFAEQLHDRLGRLFRKSEVYENGLAPFAPSYARRSQSMTFNINQLSDQLTAEFTAAGGKFVRREFKSISDFKSLKEKAIINCTGYGARALCNDESVIPIRGQIGWMAHQPGAYYGAYYNGVQLLGRRDGVLIQHYGSGMMDGYGSTDETPHQAEMDDAIRRLQGMFRVS